MSTQTRTYADALAALYGLVPRGIVLGLEPTRAALAARGDPQLRTPAVHIAGTNGKGSVSAMVDAGLRAAGRRVGLYTSPHLHRFVERIRIEGAPVDEAALEAAIWRVLDEMQRDALPAMTFFEAATVVAWDLFARASLDHVVLEVGLGGRLDSTTVCAPTITAITRIARDHEARLGNTLGEIAGEKAGILKPGVPCVVGAGLRRDACSEARDAIDRVASEVGAAIVESPDARVLSMDDRLRARIEVDAAGGALVIDLALAGSFQVENAATAVTVLERLGVAREHIVEGLSRVVWPARLERIGSLLFDAAHNPDGATALAHAVNTIGTPVEKRALVFGASNDKDWRAMLAILDPLVPRAHRFFCAAQLRRAEAPEVLAAHAGGVACDSVREAVDAARATVGDDGLVIVCGSIFAVAEARGYALGIECDPLVGM